MYDNLMFQYEISPNGRRCQGLNKYIYQLKLT